MMNDEDRAEYGKTLDELVELNLRSRQDAVRFGSAAHMSTAHWLHEMCTVKVSAGRQLGATTWAINKTRAEPWTAMVVHSEELARQVRREGALNVFSARQSCFSRIDRGIQRRVFSTIIIDLPRHCGEVTPLAEMYGYYMHPSIDQTFILLGD